VLKVLEEQRIPIHAIAGTSMGSIVGAAYASGRTIEEIEKLVLSTDWDLLFNEAPPRRMVTFRRKSGKDGELYGDAKIGIQDGDITIPAGWCRGRI
jgi:NTE family protein